MPLATETLSDVDLALGMDLPEGPAWEAFTLLKAGKLEVDPARKAEALDTLRTYTERSRAHDRPLFPEATQRANRQRRDTLAALIDGEPADFLGADKAAAFEQQAQSAPDPERFQARLRVKAYLEGLSGTQIAPDAYDLARDRYARQLGLEGDTSDKAVLAHLRERTSRHQALTAELEATAGHLTENILNGTFDREEARERIRQTAKSLDPATREAFTTELFLHERKVSDLRRAARPIADRFLRYLAEDAERRKGGQEITAERTADTSGDPRYFQEAIDQFLDLDPETQAAVGSLLSRDLAQLEDTADERVQLNAPADAPPGTDPGSVRRFRAPTAVRRTATGLSRQAIEGLRALIFMGTAQAAGVPVSDVAGQGTDFDKRTRAFAALTGASSQMPTFRASDNWVDKSILGPASQAPTLAAFFGGPITLGALGTSMVGQSYTQQRLETPGGDPTLQATAAITSGALQVATERAFTGLGLKLLRGKVPSLAKLLGKSGVTSPGARAAIAAPILAGGAAATEYSEEVIQGATDQFLSDLATELSGLEADTDWGQFLADWSPTSGTRQAEETLWAVIPFALVGSGAVGSYSHFKHGEWLKGNRKMLKAIGIPEDKIEAIATAEPEEAATLTRQAFQEGLEKATADARAEAIAVLREGAELFAQAGMPIVFPDTNGFTEETVHVFQSDPFDPATRQEFETEEEAYDALREHGLSIETAALEEIMQAATEASIDSLTFEGTAGESVTAIPREGQGPTPSQAPDTRAADGQPFATREQVEARVKDFLLQGGSAKDVENLVFKARRFTKALRDGSFREFVEYFKGSADPIALYEDFSEAFIVQALRDGFLTPAELGAHLRAAEKATGQTYLDPGTDPATSTGQARLVEAFSALARDYVFTSIRSQNLPDELRQWVGMSALVNGQNFAYARELQRSPALAKAIEEKRFDSKFEALIADAVGLNQTEIDARLRRRYEDQLEAEALGDFPEIREAAKGKLPHPQTLRDQGDPLAAEAQRIYDGLKKPTSRKRKDGKVIDSVTAATNYFLPHGTKADLDKVRQSLNELGFDFDTPADLLQAVDESVNYGVATYGTRNRLSDNPDEDPSFALSPASLTRLESTIAKKMTQGPVERADFLARAQNRLLNVFARYEDNAPSDPTDTQARERAIRKALYEVEAIIGALPPEARGYVRTPIRRVLDAKTERGKTNALRDLIEDADKALERVLRENYLDAIERLVDLAQPDLSPSRQLRSKLTPKQQRLVDEIKSYIHLDLAAYETTKYLANIPTEELEPTATQFIAVNLLHTQRDQRIQEIDGQLADLDPATQQGQIEALSKERAELSLAQSLLETFGALTSKDSGELAHAFQVLEHIYREGRIRRSFIEEDRRQALAADRAEIIRTLGSPTQEDWAKRTADMGFKDAALGWVRSKYSFHQIMETLFPGSPVAAKLQERARQADTGVKRAKIAARERWENFARTKLLRNGKPLPAHGWKFHLDRMLAGMSSRESTGIEIAEGTRFEEISLTVDQAEGVLAGRIKVGWRKDELAMNSLAQAIADYRLERIRDKKKREGKIRFRRLVKRGKPSILHASQFELLYILQLARQEGYLPALDRHGITEDVLKQIKEKINPNTLRIGDYLAREYDAEWSRLNPVFQRLYGMDMPRIRHYAPGHFDTMKDQSTLDPESGAEVPVNAMSNGMTKARNQHIARPKQMNAMSVYWAHIENAEYFIHWAELVRDARAIFGAPDVRRAIQARYGLRASNDFYRWLEVLETDGRRQEKLAAAKAHYTANMQLAMSATGLAFNIGSVMKQLGAIVGAGLGMTHKEAITGFMRALQDPARFKHVWHQESIQHRIKEGLNPEDKRILDAAKAKPSLILDLYVAGRLPLALGDAAITTLYGTWAYSNALAEAKAANMSEADAEAFALEQLDRIVKATAQPATTQDKSLSENLAGSMDHIIGYIFRSDPRQKLAIVMKAAEDYRSKRIELQEFGRKVLWGWVLYGLLNQALGDAWLAMSRDDDEAPERDWEDYLASAVAGPVSGGGLAGSILDVFVNKLISGDAFGSRLAPDAASSIAGAKGSRLLQKALDDIDDPYDDLLKAAMADARNYSAAFGALDPRLAAPSVGLRVLRDAGGLIDNLVPTESERQDQIVAETRQAMMDDREARREAREATEPPKPQLGPQERALSRLTTRYRAQAISRIIAPMSPAERRDYLSRLRDVGLLTDTVAGFLEAPAESAAAPSD